MKLKNIIFALLVICCLPACSKDEPVVGGDSGEAAEASVSFVVSSDPTKAVVVTGKESFIRTLTAYIFKDEPGYPFVTSKTITSDGQNTITQIEDIKVKVQLDENGNSADKFVVVFVANATPATDVSSLDVLMASTIIHTADFSDGILPMSSAKIRFANLKAGDNWVYADSRSNDGFVDGNVEYQPGKANVALTRFVSRVEVDKLDVNFSDDGSAEGSIPVKYPNASFTLHTISLVNVNATTNISGEVGVPSYLRGLSDAVYNPLAGELTWIASSGYLAYLTHDYSGNLVELKGSDEFFFIDKTDAKKDGEKFVRYMYPNSAAKGTALLISGMFKRNASAEPEMRYYRAYLNEQGLTSPASIGRNNQYVVTIHINGEGSDKPDPISETVGISVGLSVKPWNVYEQNSGITN